MSPVFVVTQMYRQDDDEPKVGGGFIATFLLLLVVCMGAFGAASGGVFDRAAPAHIIVPPDKLAARSWG